MSRRYLVVVTDCGDGTVRRPVNSEGIYEIGADGEVKGPEGRPGFEGHRIGRPASLTAIRELIADLVRYEADTQPSALLVGRVLDAMTAQPIGGAELRLEGVKQRAVLSTPDGWFVFRDVAAFSYQLEASRAGWLSGGIVAPDALLRVTAGERRSDIELRLHRAPGIHGEVREESGRPLVYVPVTAYRLVDVGGDRRMAIRGSERTDERGRYAFQALEPGDYILVADLDLGQGEPGDLAGRRFLPSTFHPGGTWPSMADAITVRADEPSRTADIVVQSLPARRITGRVRNTGSPARPFFLSISTADPLIKQDGWRFGTKAIRSAADGSYVFDNLAPGEYDVSVTPYSEPDSWVTRRIVVWDTDVENVDFTLHGQFPPLASSGAAATPPTGTSRIVGVVVDAEGKPLSRTRVTFTHQETQAVRRVETDAHGRLAVSRVAPGRHVISLARDGYIALPPPQGSSPDTHIDVVAGETANVTLAMRRGGVITGAVYDEHGAPAQGVGVKLFRVTTQDERSTIQEVDGHSVVAGLRQRDATDFAGRYRFFGVPAGEYLIAAAPSELMTPGASLTRAAVDRALAEAAMTPRLQGGSPGVTPSAPAALPPQTSSAATRRARLRVFHPNAITSSTAARVVISEGEESGHDIHLVQGLPVAVSGTIVVEAGLVPTNVSARLVGLDVRTRTPFVSVYGNTFSASDVQPGRYALIAETRPSSRDPAGRRYARIDLDVGTADVSDLHLVLGPTAFLRARLVVDDKDSRGNVPLLLRLEATDGTIEPPGKVTGADPDGRLTLLGIAPGRYHVGVLSASGQTIPWVVHSVTLNGAPLPENILDVRQVGSLGEAVIRLRRR